MTAHEKAKEWIDEFYGQNDREKAIDALDLLLRQQDRDTRHGCAEAVLACNEDVSGECIWKNDAHAACMNTRSV